MERWKGNGMPIRKPDQHLRGHLKSSIHLNYLSYANHLPHEFHLNSQLQMWRNFAISAQSSGTVAVKRDSIAAIGQGSGAQQNSFEESK
jgi:hypothetical protein